jgi:hypothetical protein
MYAGTGGRCAPCCVVGRDRRAYRLAASIAIDCAPRPVSLPGDIPGSWPIRATTTPAFDGRETGTLDADGTVRAACSGPPLAPGLRRKPTGQGDAGGDGDRARSHEPVSSGASEHALRGNRAPARRTVARQLLAQPRERPAGAAGQARGVSPSGVGWLRRRRAGAATRLSNTRQRGARACLLRQRYLSG